MENVKEKEDIEHFKRYYLILPTRLPTIKEGLIKPKNLFCNRELTLLGANCN